MNKLFYQIPIPFTFNAIRKLANLNVLVVNYHVVSDIFLPHVNQIYNYRNTIRFVEDLDFLCRHYNTISLPELIDHLKNGHKLPEKALLLTIDDGLKEIYHVIAPILKKRNILPAVFLTSSYIDNKELGDDHKKSLLINKLALDPSSPLQKRLVDFLRNEELLLDSLNNSIIGIPYKKRSVIDVMAKEAGIDFTSYLRENSPYLTSDQVMELKNSGYAFGGHSINHPRFSELTIEEQLQQAQESMDFVCNHFAVPYKAFAFPYWDAAVSYEFFNKLGADVTFGTQGLLTDPVQNHIQRIGFERFKYSAAESIKAHYCRKLILTWLHAGMSIRP